MMIIHIVETDGSFVFSQKSLSWILFTNFLCLTKYTQKTLLIDRPTWKTVQHSDSELAQRYNSNEETRRVVILLLLFCVDGKTIQIL